MLAVCALIEDKPFIKREWAIAVKTTPSIIRSKKSCVWKTGFKKNIKGIKTIIAQRFW